MSTEAKNPKYDNIVDLVSATYNNWFELGFLPKSERENFTQSIKTLYKIAGITLDTFEKETKHLETDKLKIHFTLEGSGAATASDQLDPDLPIHIRLAILQNSIIPQRTDLQTSALADFMPARHASDTDILLQFSDVEKLIDIFDSFFPTNSSGQIDYLYLPKGYTIKKSEFNAYDGCHVMRLNLMYKNSIIHHIDLSRNPTEPNLKTIDNRTDESGRSLHDIFKHPLTATEDGNLIIEGNRRAHLLTDPEHAYGVGEDKSPEAATEISIRDMRKAVEALISHNHPRTVIADLLKMGKFLTPEQIDNISSITPDKYNELSNYYKTSWIKEVMIIATLDPFLALWWLHTTGLDASLMGIHYENLGDATKQLARHLSGIKDVEQSRREYSELGRGDGWQIIANIYKLKVD